MKNVASIPPLVLGALLALVGLLLVAGAGGDNEQRATVVAFGHELSTYLAGGVVLAVAVAVIVAAAAIRRRFR